MKYKRKKATQKYISDTSPNKSAVKKTTLRRRSVIAASITITLFCASRLGFVNTETIKKEIFIDGKNNISEFTEKNLPFLKTIGKLGSQFCFGYLKGESENTKAVFADSRNEASPSVEENEPEKTVKSDSSALSDISSAPAAEAEIFAPIMPCNGKISSPFGERTHPVSGEGKFHNGLDIAANVGTEIKATESGTVEKSIYDQFSGNLVVIKHSGGYTSSYAHMSRSLVSAGQEVKKGDIIGHVGSTGISTGPHLHIEIRKNGEPIDPNSFYNVS